MKRKILGIVLFFCLSGPLCGKDSITVYIFLLDECPICQEATAELNSLYALKSTKTGFLGVFPNFVSKPQQISAFKRKFNIKFPTKTDYGKTLVMRFGATALPEVIVYNETKKKVLYRGCIDDRYTAPTKRKYHVSYQYLREALTSIANNRSIIIASTKPIGCVIETKQTF